MSTDGADLRSLGTDDEVTAVAALPYLNTGFLKYLLGLHIFQKGTVAFLMALLNGGNAAETGSQRGEAFFFGFAGHALIHVGPFGVLALGGMQQVFG